MAFVGCVMCARWVSGVETRSTGSAPHTLSQPRQLEHIPLPRQEGQLEPLRCQVRPWDFAKDVASGAQSILYLEGKQGSNSPWLLGTRSIPNPSKEAHTHQSAPSRAQRGGGLPSDSLTH